MSLWRVWLRTTKTQRGTNAWTFLFFLNEISLWPLESKQNDLKGWCGCLGNQQNTKHPFVIRNWTKYGREKHLLLKQPCYLVWMYDKHKNISQCSDKLQYSAACLSPGTCWNIHLQWSTCISFHFSTEFDCVGLCWVRGKQYFSDYYWQ